MSERKETPDVMSQLQGLGSAPPLSSEEKKESPPSPASPPSGSRRRSSAKRRTPKSRLKGRATYDIGPELKEAIRQESIDLGVPASQLAKYLLLYAWDFYVNQEIPEPPLRRSESPRFRNVIDLGE
jgi:hypothetical protein